MQVIGLIHSPIVRYYMKLIVPLITAYVQGQKG